MFLKTDSLFRNSSHRCFPNIWIECIRSNYYHQFCLNKVKSFTSSNYQSIHVWVLWISHRIVILLLKWDLNDTVFQLYTNRITRRKMTLRILHTGNYYSWTRISTYDCLFNTRLSSWTIMIVDFDQFYDEFIRAGRKLVCSDLVSEDAFLESRAKREQLRWTR